MGTGQGVHGDGEWMRWAWVGDEVGIGWGWAVGSWECLLFSVTFDYLMLFYVTL